MASNDEPSTVHELTTSTTQDIVSSGADDSPIIDVVEEEDDTNSKTLEGSSLTTSIYDEEGVLENVEPVNHPIHNHSREVDDSPPPSMININSTTGNHVQVISDANIASVTDNNGAVYLLVSNDSTSVLQTVGGNRSDTISVISEETLKSAAETNSDSTVQIINSEGVPVTINVNELLCTISGSKENCCTESNSPSSANNILSLSSSIISTTESSAANQILTSSARKNITNRQFIINESSTLTSLPNVPNWALHLRDCTLFGDTYTGYVTDEVEMDAVLNMYKKETQSLFAIRQTPSPAKEETTETVRLMWKSQYVPYDGIPFVNVGRRATVMECEHGPRKRNNALKRMIQLHGQKNAMKKLPNLTCPARLFVKKVRKFPQYRVPLNADAKLVRQLQEQSLKLVRQAGFKTGEVRLYMQLPLPTAHRYHNIGSSINAFQRELEEPDDTLGEPIAVDGRVLEKIQELVRQGFMNAFVVRAAVKDYVENKMQINVQETRPNKYNKAFYPPLIEIQNIIQQTHAALNTGMLSPLPAPAAPPIPSRPKRKRTTSLEAPQSPLVIKRMKIDAPTTVSEGANRTTAIVDSLTCQASQKDESSVDLSTVDPSETISLTLTDSQLENFSVQNFTYDQLAQLAKIGLLALNNAAKDTNSEHGDEANDTSSALKVENNECVDAVLSTHAKIGITEDNHKPVEEAIEDVEVNVTDTSR